MQALKMYSIVKFIDSDEMEIVAASWLCETDEGKFCLWPQHLKPQNLKKALLEARKPEVSWIPNKISILGTYDGYHKAKQKLKLMENASNLETEEGEPSAKKQCSNQLNVSEEQNHQKSSEKSKSLQFDIDCQSVKQEPPDCGQLERECDSSRSFNTHQEEAVVLCGSSGARQKSITDEITLNLGTEVQQQPSNRPWTSQGGHHSSNYSCNERNSEVTSKNPTSQVFPQIVYCSTVGQELSNPGQLNKECHSSRAVVVHQEEEENCIAFLQPAQKNRPSYQNVLSQSSVDSDFPNASKNRTDMDRIVDDIGQENIDPEKTGLFQKSRKRKNKDLVNNSLGPTENRKNQCQKKCLNEIQHGMQINCQHCTFLQEAVDQLQLVLKQKEEELESLKGKYARLKDKYKVKKQWLKEYRHVEEAETTILGDNVQIPTNKLLLCRSHGLSKYVGDVLETVFGKEVLSQSVLRAGNRNSKKENVLDPNVICDIVSHVVGKYGSPANAVRAAIRQKLNTCHKDYCRKNSNK